MNLVLRQAENSLGLNIGIMISDWDREGVCGNSICFFSYLYSELGVPVVDEFRFILCGQVLASTAKLYRDQTILNFLCSEYSDRAVFAHLCLNDLALRPDDRIDVVAKISENDIYLGYLEVTHTTDRQYPSYSTAVFPPLLINSLGRSGSTVFANCLGQHPDILTIGSYPFEYRFFSYCLQSIYVLTSPANHSKSMGGDSFELREPFSIGFNPFNHREYDRVIGGDQFRDFYQHDFVKNTVSFFIEQFYTSLNRYAQGASFHFFVEKMPGVHLLNCAMNLIKGTREIVLTRDFWGQISSKIAFANKKGSSSFMTENPSWLYEMAVQHRSLAERATLPHVIHVSYDDIVTRPGELFSELIGALGLKKSDSIIKKMISPTKGNEYRSKHSTKRIGKDLLRSFFSEEQLQRVDEMLLK